MFRIERQRDGCVTKLRLSGRIQLNQLHCLESAMRDGLTPKILDLSEVTLVDLEVIRFLVRREDEGIDLVQCPPYVREWILRERAELALTGLSEKP